MREAVSSDRVSYRIRSALATEKMMFGDQKRSYPLRELLAGENSTPAPRAVGALWNPHPLEIITNTGQIILPSEAASGELG